MVRSQIPPNASLRLGGDDPLERALRASGIVHLCGVDEAGRGPLAGPVVAAAVVYRDCAALWDATDSKQLTPAAREAQFARITQEMEWAVGACDHVEIDRLNILQATLLAMRRAVSQLSITPDLTLVDGRQNLEPAFPSRAIVHGDARIAVIGAASIIAKVTRDRMMREFDYLYPGYGFAHNFGYPTAEHRRALQLLGPCSIHRRTFRGVHEHFSKAADEARG